MGSFLILLNYYYLLVQLLNYYLELFYSIFLNEDRFYLENIYSTTMMGAQWKHPEIQALAWNC